MHIREARLPEDYPSMAEVITAEHSGNYPVSAADLAEWDAARSPGLFQAVMLAEMGGEIIGVGSVGHIPYSYHAHKYAIDLRVRPERQGQGAGKALYATLMERLAAREPQEVIAEAWEALPRPARFLTERGFQAVWRRVDATLQVEGFDFRPYAGLEDRLHALGVEVVTYAGLEGDPLRDARLHGLDWALLQDMPFGEPQTQISLDEFINGTLHSTHFLPEACFIARQGDEWAGYSNLLRGDTWFDTQMTGVRQGWRGLGIATLLKLKGIEYSLAHGGLEVRTTNDSVNAAMLAINRRLGFREVGATIRYKKFFKRPSSTSG